MIRDDIIDKFNASDKMDYINNQLNALYKCNITMKPLGYEERSKFITIETIINIPSLDIKYCIHFDTDYLANVPTNEILCQIISNLTDTIFKNIRGER